MKQAIPSQYKKMSTDVKLFEQNMKDPEDSCEIDDVKQQYLLPRQYRQEKIADLESWIDQKEFAGLMYHISDPNSFKEAMKLDAPRNGNRQ